MILDDLKKELRECETWLRIICSYNKNYNCHEINKLIRKIDNLHLRINQEKMKLFAPDHRRS